MKDFVITQYPKRYEMFWVSSKALSTGKISTHKSRGKGGENYGPNLPVLEVCLPNKGRESVGSMWTPQQVSRHGVGL